jgi:myo-inositol 2-dehydrogenase/D-chiro-inositol 1-dehydrogenase
LPSSGAACTFRSVRSGTIGDVHPVRITSRDPAPPPLEYAGHSGGLFLDMTIHDFDMAGYVTGSEVIEVFARGAVRIVPEFVEIGDIDTAAVTLVHTSGAITVIDNSRQAVFGYDQRARPSARAGWRPRTTRSRTPASCERGKEPERRRCRTSSSATPAPKTRGRPP